MTAFIITIISLMGISIVLNIINNTIKDAGDKIAFFIQLSIIIWALTLLIK